MHRVSPVRYTENVLELNDGSGSTETTWRASALNDKGKAVARSELL
jgi:hypothetical protein